MSETGQLTQVGTRNVLTKSNYRLWVQEIQWKRTNMSKLKVGRNIHKERRN